MRAIHLNALQSLLARDADAGALHNRHLLLLGAICAERGPVSLTSAADLIEMSYEQTSRLVRRLIDVGLLERAFDPDNARVHHFTPTSQGVALDARVRAYVTAVSAVPSVPVKHTTEA